MLWKLPMYPWRGRDPRGGVLASSVSRRRTRSDGGKGYSQGSLLYHLQQSHDSGARQTAPQDRQAESGMWPWKFYKLQLQRGKLGKIEFKSVLGGTHPDVLWRVTLLAPLPRVEKGQPCLESSEKGSGWFLAVSSLCLWRPLSLHTKGQGLRWSGEVNWEVQYQ